MRLIHPYLSRFSTGPPTLINQTRCFETRISLANVELSFSIGAILYLTVLSLMINFLKMVNGLSFIWKIWGSYADVEENRAISCYICYQVWENMLGEYAFIWKFFQCKQLLTWEWIEIYLFKILTKGAKKRGLWFEQIKSNFACSICWSYLQWSFHLISVFLSISMKTSSYTGFIIQSLLRTIMICIFHKL